MNAKERLIHDAANLSSGTIASMTKWTAYEDIQRVQDSFVRWCAAIHANRPDFRTWQEAWAAFAEACGPRLHPRRLNASGRQVCCRICHTCLNDLRETLDGELWCETCGSYR